MQSSTWRGHVDKIIFGKGAPSFALHSAGYAWHALANVAARSCLARSLPPYHPTAACNVLAAAPAATDSIGTTAEDTETLIGGAPVRDMGTEAAITCCTAAGVCCCARIRRPFAR